MKKFLLQILSLLLLTSCAPVIHEAVPEIAPEVAIETPTEAAKESGGLQAGFRYSSYGHSYNPGPEYWPYAGEQMVAKAHISTLTARQKIRTFAAVLQI